VLTQLSMMTTASKLTRPVSPIGESPFWQREDSSFGQEFDQALLAPSIGNNWNVLYVSIGGKRLTCSRFEEDLG
jgi:hypothetical protein